LVASLQTLHESCCSRRVRRQPRISWLSSTTRIRTGDVFCLASKTDILKRTRC
jgi:hypothetical protein